MGRQRADPTECYHNCPCRLCRETRNRDEREVAAFLAEQGIESEAAFRKLTPVESGNE